MKTHLEVQQRGEHPLWSCWMDEVCSSRSSSRRKCVLLARRSEQNSARTEIWKTVEGGDYCCQGPHGGYQYWCIHLSSKCKQTEKTSGHCGFGRTSGFAWANRSTCVVAFFWRSKGCLGAVFWQFLYECYPWSTRTPSGSTSWPQNQEDRELLTTAIAGLLVKAQEKESQDCPDVPNGYCQKLEAKKRFYGNSTVCAWPQQNTKILGGWTSSHVGTRIRKDLVVENGTIPSETVSLPMDSPAWTETQVDFS